MDSLVTYPASLHRAPRLKNNAINKFTTAEKVFEILHAAHENTDKEHTARIKFQDLQMTKDFNSFWVEFLALASELNSNKSTLIIKIQQKLMPALSCTLATLPKSTSLLAYAEQCQIAYRNLQDIDKRMGKLTTYNSN